VPDHLGSSEDLLVVMSTVADRVGDLIAGLDEPRLGYRHAPALPTVTEAVTSLCQAGIAVDGLLRHAYLDPEQREIALNETLRSTPDADVSPPAAELLDAFSRVRRRTIDLLRGMSPDDWRRTFVDSRDGELMLFQVCERITRQEIGRLGMLRNLVALVPAV